METTLRRNRGVKVTRGKRKSGIRQIRGNCLFDAALYESVWRKLVYNDTVVVWTADGEVNSIEDRKQVGDDELILTTLPSLLGSSGRLGRPAYYKQA